jgi:hypothetical protein
MYSSVKVPVTPSSLKTFLTQSEAFHRSEASVNAVPQIWKLSSGTLKTP